MRNVLRSLMRLTTQEGFKTEGHCCPPTKKLIQINNQASKFKQSVVWARESGKMLSLVMEPEIRVNLQKAENQGQEEFVLKRD